MNLLAGLGQIPDRGQPRDGWHRDSGSSTPDWLLLARDHQMNDASAKLAIEKPTSVALFDPQLWKIGRLCIEET
jgi:hypothetical protein